jgi:hypothetical protein
MRFGGHESFAVREGWLSRGLELLTESPDLLDDEYAEDHLGVGRNMAKAIRHWLHATGLAEESEQGTGRLEPTKLGTLVRRKDPHLLDFGTWWLLHVNLVATPDQAFSWHWFFNHWSLQRFDRSPCIEALKRHAATKLPRTPAARTIERDLATLLQSYARPIPARVDDPEDSSESPFQDLALVHHHIASGYYQLNYAPKNIGLNIFGYAISRMPKAASRSELSISELERADCSPGRCFLLRGDDIYDLVQRFEQQDRASFALRSQAGERGVKFEGNKAPLDWAKAHFAASEITTHV